MDDETLILEIKNHEIIYDPAHPFYKDNFKKEEAWNCVAKAIGVEGNADRCKAKWRSLRDSFVRSRKKIAGSQREWKYIETIGFLLPYVNPRSKKKKLSSDAIAEEERASTPVFTSGHEESAPMSPSISDYEAEAVSAAQSASMPSTPLERDGPHRSQSPRERRSRSHSRRSHRPQQTSDGEERHPSVSQETIPKPESDLDECYHFAMSLVPQLYRMDHKQRLQAKVGIINLMYNI